MALLQHIFVMPVQSCSNFALRKGTRSDYQEVSLREVIQCF